MERYPFAQVLYIMAKPVGASCNLRCKYCYYLEKKKYYSDKNKMLMNDALLEKFIKEYIECQTAPVVLFTWHGGEPLLLSLDFFKKVVVLQKRYAQGRIINNCLQTNGVLLTEEWCKFLKENNFLVGISIDGQQEFHDEFRKTKTGQPTFTQVMQAINLLNNYGVDWNAMAVVNCLNADFPKEFYHFFKSINCQYIQFTPVVERFFNETTQQLEVTDYSVSPDQWGNFTCGVFDEWLKNDVGKVFVQLFDATLANWVGEPSGVCSLSRTCGHAAVMEHNGDLYSCDHFVFPENRLGNIHEKSLFEMMYSDQQRDFGVAKHENLAQKCLDCEFLFTCNGECPKNRFCKNAADDVLTNYLCDGYYKFFSHTAPAMNFMANEWRNKRSPANVMKYLSYNP
jgi:uncharacterized protein